MADDNVALVTRFIDVWKHVDIDLIMEFIALDCLYHNIPMPKVEGYDAIRETLLGFIKPVSEIEWLVHHIGETRDGVVLTERLDRFRTGEHWLEVPVMGSFVIEGKKIKVWKDYFDLGQLLNQNPGGAAP